MSIDEQMQMEAIATFAFFSSFMFLFILDYVNYVHLITFDSLLE